MSKTCTNIANSFETETFTKYCNAGVKIVNEELKTDIEKSLSDVNKQLAELSEMESINVTSIIDNDDVTFIFIFKALNSSLEKYVWQLDIRSIESFKQEFNSLIKLIVTGCEAVLKLNAIVKNIQQKQGASVSISYKWSISENICHVAYWDYDKIKIKLSKNAVSKLIVLQENSQLEEEVASDNWGMSIKNFIETFNENKFHCKIEAILEIVDLEEALISNMLSIEDVAAVIKHNKSSKGTQSLKSVSVINELGKFAVICKWSVDYSKKRISMNVMADKVLDIDTGRFISDRDLCSRVEQRLNIDRINNMIFS